MNINSFVPYEISLNFEKNEKFNIKTPYVFVEVSKVKENIIEEHKRTDIEYFKDLLIENGGTNEFDEIFEREIILTLAVNTNSIPGQIKAQAYIFDDFVQWIKSEYNFDMFITPFDGFVWNLYKHQNGVVTNISSHIKYNDYYSAFCSGLEYFIENIL